MRSHDRLSVVVAASQRCWSSVRSRWIQLSLRGLPERPDALRVSRSSMESASLSSSSMIASGLSSSSSSLLLRGDKSNRRREACSNRRRDWSKRRRALDPFMIICVYLPCCWVRCGQLQLTYVQRNCEAFGYGADFFFYDVSIEICLLFNFHHQRLPFTLCDGWRW